MDYFSEITQKTLSAFHRAGIDCNIDKEICIIKKCESNKLLTLINAVKIEDDMYKRYFDNGYTDTVTLNDLYKKVIDKVTDTDIKNNEPLIRSLKKEIIPISKMTGKKYYNDIVMDEEKDIDSLCEKIFFM